MSGAKKKKHKARGVGSKPSGPRPSASSGFWGAPLHEWCTAVGLAMLIYWRPWQDGIVAADSNVVFLLGIVVLFGAWTTRGIVRGVFDIPLVPCLLLSGFLAAAWLTRFTSVQYYATSVALTIWCGHAMVFVLASSLRSGAAMGFVLAFVAVTSAAEALYSVVHLKYSLPETRIFVQKNPAAAAQLFGYELNAALVHRLNSNRAFGTLLFANGLATWLVAAIPISLFGARYAIQKFRFGEDVFARVTPMARGIVGGVVAAFASTPILAFAQRVSAGINVAYSDAVVALPFSPALMRVPVASMTVVVLQMIAIGAALGGFGLLHLLIKPSKERGEESAAHALIAGVLTAGVLCVSVAVLYAHFHQFYFAELVTIDGRPQFDRPPMTEPLLPFMCCVLVAPMVAGGIAIRIARKRGPAMFVWLALAVVFAMAALCQGAALWMTYSRGGMLALAVGMAVTLFLLRPGKSAPETLPLLNTAAAALIMIFVTMFVCLGGDAHAQNPNMPPAENPFVKDINVEGADMTIGDLVNPTTVTLRFSYWSGAFRMAMDHFIGGVGLGNFGVTYPQYQPLGGGDSKQAHNDFLQLLCETGLFGLTFFAGFWACLLVAGGRRLRAEASSEGAWWLAGLYAAVTGFLVHAFVDFPFVDPSLAMLAFLLAGLFWAKARNDETTVIRNPGIARAAASIGLVLAIAVINLSARTGHVDAAVGDDRIRQERVRTASIFLRGFEKPSNTQPSVEDWKLALVVKDPETRKAFGTHFYRSSPNDQNWKPLPPGSPIPAGSMLMLTHPPLATAKVKEACVGWTTRFAETDLVFPHDSDFAFHISLWYDMLWRSGERATDGNEYIKQAVEWAERAVDRNPGQVAYHDWLFKMRWRRALSEQRIEDQLMYYELSLDAIDRTVDLYPIKEHLWNRHAQVYYAAAKKFAERGRTDRAEECTAIMKQSEQEAASIRERLAEIHNQ